MKSRSLHYVLGFLSFVVTIGLACSAVTGSPTAAPPPPTQPPASPTVQPAAPTPEPAATSSSGDSTPSADSSLITFTDKNKYFQIDLPGDWTHDTNSGDNDYADTFTSPDGNAIVDSYVYDDGNTSWNGKASGKAALYMLNKFYSKTGAEGDIRVTEEKQQSDGSDRLTWLSKSGKYSGISFFEVRHNTAFLMFTVYWSDDSKDQYLDTLNNVIASYRLP